MSREHKHDPELLAQWALAVDPDRADLILAGLNGCAVCAAEAARLRDAVHALGAVEPVRPPPRLRESVLAAARARRRAAPVTMHALAYAGQVEALDALLAGLSPVEWRAAVPGDRNVRDLIAHLTANDALVEADLGLAPVDAGRTHIRRRWRERAGALLDEVRTRPSGRLDQPVRMAGRTPTSRALSDGLIQRAFETWIHADDVRSAVHLPQRPPPPEHVHLIADLGARLLPGALAAQGVRRPGGTARLELQGPGGGGWDIPLGSPPTGHGGEPVVVITADAVEFCRLLAGRRTPAGFSHNATGDRALIRLILQAATTLGCE